MAIPREIIEDIKDKTDIVELISSYIPLKKSGRNFRALCPFHSEKTPSFFVSSNRQIFHCFGCGIGGGAIRFVMEYEKVNFPEAVEMLGNRLGIQIPKKRTPFESKKTQGYKVNKEACNYFHKNLFTKAGKRHLAYLKNRGITEDTIKEFKLGLALPGFRNLLDYMRSKKVSISLLDNLGLVSSTRKGNYIDMFRNRIIFPVFDIKSRVLAFGGRRVSEEQGPKYINTPESLLYHKGKCLFGSNLAKKGIIENDFCIIVEGYTDMVVPFQEGVTNIVASLGTALTKEQIRTIKRYTNNIVLLFDSDSAGKNSTLRAIDLVIEEGVNVKVVTLPPETDPDDFILKYGKEEFLKLVKSGEDFFVYKLNMLKEQYDIKDLQEKSKISAEMLSTLKRFDNYLVKYEYLKKLAESLDTSEEFLRMELDKVERGKKIQFEKPDFKKKDDLSFDEEYIVKCMLSDIQVLEFIKNSVDIESFSSVLLKDVSEKCFNYFDENGSSKMENILSRLEGETASWVSEFFMEDFVPEEEILKESILKLKRKKQKKRRRVLSEKIKEAEKKHDKEKLVELVSEYEKLIKEEKMC